MPAMRKTVTCVSVALLSLPLLVSGSIASPRDYDDGTRHQRSYDNKGRVSDDSYYRSGDRRDTKRAYYTDQYGDLDTSNDKRHMRHRGSKQGEDSEVVQGKIINIQGGEYTVRTRDGERVRFLVSGDTNMVCRSSKKSHSMGSATTESSSAMSQSQGSQQRGGSSSSGMSSENHSERAGFQFGDCDFQTGDRVKARIDDSGDAQLVRYVKGQKGSSQSMSRSRSGRDFERPAQYTVLPAGALGSLNPKTRESAFPVKTKEGEEVGNIIKVLNDSEGNPAYAIIKKKDGGQLTSVPWDGLETAEDGKSATLQMGKNQVAGLPNLEEGESTTSHVQKNWDLNEDDEEMSMRERYYSPQDRYARGDRERKRFRSQSRDSDPYYSRPYLKRDRRR